VEVGPDIVLTHSSLEASSSAVTTKISIVTPVFNPPLWALEECINSVINQTFQDWEWCIADDCSTIAGVWERLDRLARSDDRVKLIRRAVNGGIVAASNSALDLASGDYVALLDHDDSLTRDALEIVGELISYDPFVDYIYTDEDKINADGVCFDTFVKPDWAPERLLGQNYCCHLSVLRRSIVNEVGGFRPGFEGSQDYDLILRVTERAKRIHHIPRVLYHWRVVEGSTASEQFAKPYAIEAARNAVEDHLVRRGVDAVVETTVHGYQRVRRALKDWPKVSIIIPSGAFTKVIRGREIVLVLNSVESILDKTTYPNFEVVVVLDVNERCRDAGLQSVLSRTNVKVVEFSGDFDFAAKCNLGAVEASGEVLLFLNDDTEVISTDWIDVIVGHLSDAGVGMVGPRLLFEDGSIQSAGHANDPSPHSYGIGAQTSDPGEFGSLAIALERSGLTGACFALRRELYFRVGGMSLKYPHCFNDVDLCCKVLDIGYRIIWTPFVDLNHFESVSRDPTPRDEEVQAIYDRWGRYFGDDRYLPQPHLRDSLRW
jgi:glycosyltransferase involved in cell wall biosynthesis